MLLAAPLLLAAATVPVLKQVAVLDIPGRPGFDEIALAQGMILVSHPGAGEVDLFNLKKRRVVGHVRNMSSPRGVVVDEAAHLVYIANAGARNIVVVSTTDWQVKRILPVVDAPNRFCLSALSTPPFPTRNPSRPSISPPTPRATTTIDQSASQAISDLPIRPR